MLSILEAIYDSRTYGGPKILWPWNLNWSLSVCFTKNHNSKPNLLLWYYEFTTPNLPQFLTTGEDSRTKIVPAKNLVKQGQGGKPVPETYAPVEQLHKYNSGGPMF